MNFLNDRLNLGIDYGTLATLTARTGIIEEGGAGEQRSIGWEQPLLRFNLGERGYRDEKLEYIIDFQRQRKGAYQGFRFKDWSDWKAIGQAIGTGDGVTTQFQLYKSYTVAGWTVKRPITKPVEGTVKVYVDGVERVSGWTVNTLTGVITFSAAPAGAITADFEFDVPTRFEGDEIRLRFEVFEPGTGRKIYNWEGTSLVEVRDPPAILLPIDPVPPFLDHTIELGYDYGTIGGNRFDTRIDKLVSGYERRIANWDNPKGAWEIGQRTLDLEELQYLIALFRVCRGRAVGFRYLDRAENFPRSVRFGEDAIAFRFDAYERGTGRAFFNLSGVPLTAIAPSIDAGAGVCEPKTIIFADNFSFLRWNRELLEPLNNGPTFSSNLSLVSTGGNPGKFAAIRLDWGGASEAGVTSAWFKDWYYIPASASERISVTIAQDSKLLETSAMGSAGQAYGIVVKQNNNYYFAGSVTGTPSEWIRQSTTVDLATMGVPIVPNVPLSFGFYRANSNSGESGFNYSIFGIDNLTITVTITCEG
ncbi:DUF2460 domain-containing protein [Pannus brasiliensis CCIBt3594]|uniref:DUF2460 domain-containing protein n=1 Tax=Pannus brasiliensis CCIBt3594 TaxID=1427578 RepID=A0AAW9QVY9_9CHRO